jgi:hypothetical protein
MTEKRKLDFFVLRYVPDAVKGEFVNVGLVVIDPNSNGEMIDVRFTKDRSRIRSLDPEADLNMLEKLHKEIAEEIGKSNDQAMLMKRIHDSFSGAVQISGIMRVLTGKQTIEEIDEVAKTFLETPRTRREREPAGRSKLLETMRDEFDKARVLEFLRPVPVEVYTKPGDPLEFDFGYNTGKQIKMFHAVSMKHSVDSAVMLAVRYPQIKPLMGWVTGEPPLLTAVVEDQLDRLRNDVRFALEMMEENRIRVSLVSEMPAIAEKVRVELSA